MHLVPCTIRFSKKSIQIRDRHSGRLGDIYAVQDKRLSGTYVVIVAGDLSDINGFDTSAAFFRF